MKDSTYSRRSQTVSTVQQVAGDDPGSVLAQERPPGAVGTPRRRVEPVAPQRGPDRGCGGLHAKMEQLALDAPVAPARVLRRQPDGQLLHVRGQWRPASLVRVGPGAGDQASVPAQQRVGRDEEAGPATSGQHAADRGEQRPVGGFQPGAGHLAAEHRELVAQHEDLQVLGGVAADQQHEQLDGAAQREIRELR
jgi:hypothetical protein